MEAVNSSTHQ